MKSPICAVAFGIALMFSGTPAKLVYAAETLKPDTIKYTIADVGPPGSDMGKGGKYLFLPPGYEGADPDGYLVFRPVSKNGVRLYAVKF